MSCSTNILLIGVACIFITVLNCSNNTIETTDTFLILYWVYLINNIPSSNLEQCLKASMACRSPIKTA